MLVALTRPRGAETPDARRGGVAGELAEVPRLAAERALHPVHQVGVAAVEDLAEQVRQQPHDLGRHFLLRKQRLELLHRDGHVPELPVGRPGDLVDRLLEGQQAWAGDLVELAHVALFGQCRDRDVGDVVDVDERLRRIAGRECDLPGEHEFEEGALAEVLGEPGRANDRQLGAGVAHCLLDALGLGLASAGQERQPRDPAPYGQLGKRADRLRRSRDATSG